jgi:FkbM family methyltransferase
MKLAINSVKLPPICRAYRNAFRTGHGGSNSKFGQFLSRGLFYFYEFTGLGTGSHLVVDLEVRRKSVELKLNPRNRQFSAFYFDAFKGGYERLVSLAIERLLPADGVMADVGSNWGYFPLLVASDSEFAGEIHAFEPIPSTYADLVEVVRQAGISEWVKTYDSALGDRTGSARMSLPHHSGLAKIDSGGGTEVALQRLDDFDWEKLDLVKVDVEGFESAVFRGAEQILGRCRPWVIFENGVGEGEENLEPLRILEGFGYVLFEPREESGELTFRSFSSSDAEGLPSYLNIVAAPGERARELEKG